MGGSNRVYLEARARVLPMAKRRWYSSSSFLSFLSFFSLVRFPLKQKNQRNNNEHERNSLSFQGAQEEGAWRGATGKQPTPFMSPTIENG